MSINLKIPDIRELKPRITVFGVGGAGGNAVNNMITAVIMLLTALPPAPPTPKTVILGFNSRMSGIFRLMLMAASHWAAPRDAASSCRSPPDL